MTVKRRRSRPSAETPTPAELSRSRHRRQRGADRGHVRQSGRGSGGEQRHASATRVADIAVTDDALGTETLTLSGADAASFQIVGNGLYLKAGVTLDFETKASYAVTVNADDPTVGGSSTPARAFVLAVTDVNEAPTAVTFANPVAALAENSNTAIATRVADIAVTDDALGTETLSLSGADAASFEIVGNGLYLKAGVTLDFETKASYAVTVNADDATVGGNPDASQNFVLAVTDVNEATPPVAHDDLVGPTVTPVSTTLTFEAGTYSEYYDDSIGSNVVATNDGFKFANNGGGNYQPNFVDGPSIAGFYGADDSDALQTYGYKFDYEPDPNSVNVMPIEMTRVDGEVFTLTSANIVSFNGNWFNDDPTATFHETVTGYLNGVQVAQQSFDVPDGNYFGIHNNVVGLTEPGFAAVDRVEYALTANYTSNGHHDQTFQWLDNIQAGYVAVLPNTEDRTIEIDVLGNDTAGQPDAILSVASFAATSTLGATITLNPDGTLHYDPTGSATLQALAAGETASDTFTYRTQDEHGALSNTATVTVVVNGVNDAPVANPDVAATTENAVVTIDVLANDTDVDHSAVQILQAASVPAGSVSIVNNELVFNPGTAFDYLTTGVQTTVDVAYTVADEYGAQSSSVATITITGENDAPVVATPAAMGALSFWAADGNTNDTAGNNNGTAINGVTYAPGHDDGQAFSFNGAGAFVYVGRQIQDDFTITAWINSSHNSRGGGQFYVGDGLIYADVPGLTNDFGTSILNNHFAFGTGGENDITIQSTSTVTTGDWVYVAAVRAGSIISVYVNGVLEASGNIGYTGPLNSPSAITFGGNTVDGRYYTGLIDDVAIYDHALTSAEIAQGYTGGGDLHYVENQAAAAINPGLRRVRCRRRKSPGSDRVDHRKLPLRAGRARLHQPERDHRELRRFDRHVDSEWRVKRGELPDRAALGDIFQFERRSIVGCPHGELSGRRRPITEPRQQCRNCDSDGHAGQRRAG